MQDLGNSNNFEKSNFKIKNIKLQSQFSKFDLEINLPNQKKKNIGE